LPNRRICHQAGAPRKRYEFRRTRGRSGCGCRRTLQNPSPSRGLCLTA
jgi:hypothetical protein